MGGDQSEDMFSFHIIAGNLDDGASYGDGLPDVVIAVLAVLFVAKQTMTFQHSVHRFPRASIRSLKTCDSK